MLHNHYITVCCYLLSQLLDALDGHAARALGQSSKFGALLDMLTDRASTACIMMGLCVLYPKYTVVFQMSMALDIVSHWMHLHVSTISGNASHKAISLEGNPILKLYYTSKPVLFFYVCWQRVVLQHALLDGIHSRSHVECSEHVTIPLHILSFLSRLVRQVEHQFAAFSSCFCKCG